MNNWECEGQRSIIELVMFGFIVIIIIIIHIIIISIIIMTSIIIIIIIISLGMRRWK